MLKLHPLSIYRFLLDFDDFDDFDGDDFDGDDFDDFLELLPSSLSNALNEPGSCMAIAISFSDATLCLRLKIDNWIIVWLLEAYQKDKENSEIT